VVWVAGFEFKVVLGKRIYQIWEKDFEFPQKPLPFFTKIYFLHQSKPHPIHPENTIPIKI
jgi:hypothetical protein